MNSEMKLKPLTLRRDVKCGVTNWDQGSIPVVEICNRTELVWQLELAAGVMIENREALEKLG